MGHGKAMNRRDFVALTSAAMGGVVLTGCGSAPSVTGARPLPNGYRYTHLKLQGDVIDPKGRSFRILDFLGSAYLSSNGILSFDAVDGDRRRGLFQLGIDFSGAEPRIAWERTALLTGDELEDHRVVARSGNYDVDDAGNIVALIDADHGKSPGHFGTGLYVDEGQTGFRPILVAGQTFDGGERKSSGIFYCASIENRDLVVSLNHLPAPGHRSPHKDSLLHVPGGDLSAAQLLISRGDYLAGTDHLAKSFGLIDHNADGALCATVFGAAPSLTAGASGGGAVVRASFNIATHVASSGDHEIITASADAQVGSSLPGEAGYAPRIGPSGEVYTLLRGDAGALSLVGDGRVILSTGDIVDDGEVLHLGPGSVGADGVYYHAARTSTADSVLLAFDGQDHVPLLASGDALSEKGQPVSRILFGTTKRHVDGEGRLAFCSTFADGSTALVIGVPS